MSSPFAPPAYPPSPHPRHQPLLGLGLLTLAALLSACSGGGGGGSTPPVPPTISGQPADTTVIEGAQAQFSVTATGSPTYQWRKGGTAVNGATAATYSTPAATSADDHSLYSVVATNGGGSVTSANATLRVNYITFGTQPTSTGVVDGGGAQFTVAATGSGTLTYQWKHDGTTIPGATTPSYQVMGATATDAGAYTCVVSSALNGTTATATSNAASLSFVGAPTITAQPADLTIASGSTATFAVGATGNGTLTYQWQYFGNDLPGETASTLAIPNADASYDTGSFSCRVTNTLGGAAAIANTTAATLHVVSQASITGQPRGGTIFAGENKTFTVVASAGGTLSYQWQKDGIDIPGATSNTYTITGAAAADAGSYTCILTNALNGISVTSTCDAAVLVVQLNPEIQTQPGSRTVYVGQKATFAVTAKGAGLTYQWYKNGTSISGATSASYQTPNAILGDSGATYHCVVSNGNPPDATSDTAHLTVKAATTAFTASNSVISQGEGVTLAWVFPTGSTATLKIGTGTATAVTSGASTVVYPTANTNYRLAVTTGGSTTNYNLTVTVKTYTAKHLYVVNADSNDIYQYDVDTTTAEFVGDPVGLPVAAGSKPVHIVASPSEQFLFVANSGDGTISAYSADATTGALTPVAGSPFALSAPTTTPWCSAVNPAGTMLYVACADGIEVFNIDGTTGALVAEPTLNVTLAGRGTGDLLIHPSGGFLYLGDSQHNRVKSYAIDPTTGALSYASEVVTATASAGLAFDRGASLLFTRGASDTPQFFGAINVFGVDAVTGALTAKSTYEGYGINAPYTAANGFDTSLPFVEGSTVAGPEVQLQVHHGLAFSRKSGVDHLFNAWMNTDQAIFGGYFSEFTVDITAGTLTGNYANPRWGLGSPYFVSNWSIFASGGDAVVGDRSGTVFVLPLPYGVDKLIAFSSDASGNIAPMLDLNGEIPRSTGTSPAHACFTGTLQ